MIGGKRLNIVEQMMLYGQQYARPPMSFKTIPSKPRKADRSVVARGYGATAGRTNGMPWDGTSPCSAGADPMAKPCPSKNVPRASDFTPVAFWDLERLWAMPANPFFALGWRELSVQLGDMAAAISDPEIAEEFELLGDIAHQRYLEKL